MLFSAKIVENITKSAYNIASWEGFPLSMPKYDCEKYYRIMNMTQLNYANQLKRLSKNQSRANIIDEIIGYISENAPCQQRRYLRFLKIIHGLLYIAPVVVLILGIIFNGKHIHISFS